MSQTYGGTATQELVSIWKSFWIQNCCVCAALALIAYNHCSTITREIELMWGRKFNSVTLLFHFNRWFTLMWALVSLIYYNFLPLNISVPSCIAFNGFRVAIVLFLFTTWAAFSSIRMYAISGGNWWLAFVVCCLSMVPVGTNAFAQFTPILWEVELSPLGAQCVDPVSITKAQDVKIEFGTRFCLIASDLLVMIITWRKTYAMKRQADMHDIKTPLLTILLRDGTVYFVMLLCLNIVNIVGQVTNAFVYAGGFTFPLSSIIISHFLLKLRGVAQSPVQNDTADTRVSFGQSQPSNIRFASFVDNIGELLDYGFDHEDPDNDEKYQAAENTRTDSHTASLSDDAGYKNHSALDTTVIASLRGDVEAQGDAEELVLCPR